MRNLYVKCNSKKKSHIKFITIIKHQILIDNIINQYFAKHFYCKLTLILKDCVFFLRGSGGIIWEMGGR